MAGSAAHEGATMKCRLLNNGRLPPALLARLER